MEKIGLLQSVVIATIISGMLFLIMYYVNGQTNLGISLDRDGVSPYLILFSFGMAASFISFDRRSSALRNKIPWLLLSVIILTVNRWIITKEFFKSPYSFQFDDILFGGFASCLLISVSGEKSKWLKNILSFKPLVFMGTFAYSIYLLHFPIIQIVWQYIIYPLSLSPLKGYYIMVGLSIPIVIIISYLFYLAFERPFMNHKKPLNII